MLFSFIFLGIFFYACQKQNSGNMPNSIHQGREGGYVSFNNWMDENMAEDENRAAREFQQNSVYPSMETAAYHGAGDDINDPALIGAAPILFMGMNPYGHPFEN